MLFLDGEMMYMFKKRKALWQSQKHHCSQLLTAKVL